MRTALALSFCALALSAPLAAQDFSGTYTIGGGAVPITLTLRQDRQGRVTGSLQGQTAFQIQAQVEGQNFTGFAANSSGRLYLAGQLADGGLQLVMAEVGPDGQPQQATARQLSAVRSGGAPGMAVAPAPAPAGRGGPLGGTRGAAGDPWSGTFAGAEIALMLQRRGTDYVGTATYQGAQYPVQARVSGATLSGAYQADGQAYPLQAQLQGDVMQLAAGNQTFVLQRQAGGAAPAAAAPMGGAAAPGGGGVAGSSPQDRQLAQLLMRSAWCSFSYVSGGGSSGRSSTERVVFAADGSGRRTTGGESYYSGANGTAYGNNSGGGAFRWRTQNSMLMVSEDGVNWAPTPIQVTANSNGSPIITANGKEYSMCQ